MIQDPRIEDLSGMEPVEGYDPVRAFFLDGPTTEKVAILDFDPDSGDLKPVHFLKVSHHGSHTGTPDPDLLDKVLPAQRQDARPRTVLVSTWEDTYDNVPDQATLDLLYDPNPLSEQRRSDKMHVLYTETGDGGFVDVFFDDMEAS